MIQIDLDKLVPIEDLPGRLDQVVDDARNGAIYVVTKDDRPAVAVVSVDQLEGLSGRKVITPASPEVSESAPPPPPVEPPPPPPPAEPPAGQATPPAPPPAPDIGTPTTSVQRDLTPGATPPPPTTPPPPADPDKPLDEIPL